VVCRRTRCLSPSPSLPLSCWGERGSFFALLQIQDKNLTHRHEHISSVPPVHLFARSTLVALPTSVHRRRQVRNMCMLRMDAFDTFQPPPITCFPIIENG